MTQYEKYIFNKHATLNNLSEREQYDYWLCNLEYSDYVDEITQFKNTLLDDGIEYVKSIFTN